MHDIKFIRENPEAFDAALKRRPAYDGVKSNELLELDKANRGGKTELQNLQARRNEVAKAIGEAMRSDKAKAEELKKEAAEIKVKIAALEGGEEDGGALTDALARIPNLLAADVPDGADETANVEVRVVGSKPAIANPKDHVALGEELGLMDFEAAAKISGARFVVTRGALARLERALAAFMLDIHTTEFGYTEHQVPYLVKDDALFGTGQLPKFEEDLFSTSSAALEKIKALYQLYHEEEKVINPNYYKEIQEGFSASQQKKYQQGRRTEEETPADVARRFQVGYLEQIKNIESDISAAKKYYLIPTAEVSLTNLVRDSILDEAALATPMRLTAHTPCFRSEAGSAGRDTRGMIRQHQFSKVELVSITKPEDSEAEHERMLGCAEEVLKRLGLHYRVMLLCAGDTGFGAKKTYDLEVWLPAQDTFREISSCSNCGDFQARRMKARFKRKDAKETEFVHTLNGSGLAVGRTLVAILENYQQPDGSIRIPDALVPYMGGLKLISK
jgi:seryl-tRNA synthetase